MARNPKIEAILKAWWDSTHCPHEQRESELKRFNKLLDETIGGQPITREQLREHLGGHYSEYKREIRNREQIAVAQYAGLGKPDPKP